MVAQYNKSDTKVELTHSELMRTTKLVADNEKVRLDYMWHIMSNANMN